ncbi:MAG: hypothetical protein WAM14_08340 [Candidatus Nitrosopolaris sp.]
MKLCLSNKTIEKENIKNVVIVHHTGKPYPPTAQHVIRQGKVAAKNIISSIKNGRENKNIKISAHLQEIEILATLYGNFCCGQQWCKTYCDEPHGR